MWLLSPSVHSLVRQPIGSLVVLAEGVADFEMFEPPHQLLRLVVELAQIRMPHLVDPFHLPYHQLGIANHLERCDVVFDSIVKGSEESLIFGVVIGAVAEVLAQLSDRVAGGVLNGDTVTGRAGIAAGSAIDVRSVSGRRRFRRGFRSRKKIAGCGRARRHGASLQRGGNSKSGRTRNPALQEMKGGYPPA